MIGLAIGDDLHCAVQAGDIGFRAEGLQRGGGFDASGVAREDAGDGDLRVGRLAKCGWDGRNPMTWRDEDVAFQFRRIDEGHEAGLDILGLDVTGQKEDDFSKLDAQGERVGIHQEMRRRVILLPRVGLGIVEVGLWRRDDHDLEIRVQVQLLTRGGGEVSGACDELFAHLSVVIEFRSVGAAVVILVLTAEDVATVDEFLDFKVIFQPQQAAEVIVVRMADEYAVDGSDALLLQQQGDEIASGVEISLPPVR